MLMQLRRVRQDWQLPQLFNNSPMKQDENGFIKFGDLDPETAGVIGQGRQRQANRAKSKRAVRQARVDAARNRRMIDIPLELESHLVGIADELSVPVSQLIARLVWEGLEHLTIEKLKIELHPTRSMRYYNALPYPGSKPRRSLK